MKPKKLDTTLLWKQLEDVLYPQLGFSITDRAVYSHLFRHSRLEGKLQLHFSMPWLARGVGLSTGPVRESVRRLIALGALRLVHRSKSGHVLEVRLPDEIRAARPSAISMDGLSPASRSVNQPVNLEELDFLKTRALRQSIHLRERGHCFYCLRRTDARSQCLDHVLPRVKAGLNSYRNLVSCCLECNSLKGERHAPDFLRWLFRDRRLTASELHAGLRALDALAAGKLPPPVQHPDTPVGTAHHPESVIPSGARNPSSPSRGFRPMNFIGPKGHTPTAAKPRLPLDTPAHTLGPKGRPRGSSCRRAALLRPSFSRPL